MFRLRSPVKRVMGLRERVRRLDGVAGGGVSGPALSVRQESIAAQLREMIGEGPAAFFTDASLILLDDPRPAAASHIVAHLLREVESAVRWVLQPPENSGSKRGGDGHKRSILAVLGELGVSVDEPTAQFWLGLAGEGNPSGLAMRAHRPALPDRSMASSPSSSTAWRNYSIGCSSGLRRGTSASSHGWTRFCPKSLRGTG